MRFLLSGLPGAVAIFLAAYVTTAGISWSSPALAYSVSQTSDTAVSGGAFQIASTSAHVVDFSLTSNLTHGSIDGVKYGYEVRNDRLIMLGEAITGINSSSNIATGRGQYLVTYRGVVVRPYGSSVRAQNVGGTIRIVANFDNGVMSGSDGKLTITGTVSDRGWFSGLSTFKTHDGIILTGRAVGTAGKLDFQSGFSGTDGTVGVSGGITSGPYNQF